LHRFIACQDQYNLLSRQIETEIIPAIESHRLALIPYFPLASGMLTGKYALGAPIPAGTRMSYKRYSDRFLNDENFRIVESLRAFCTTRGRSLLELAFGWLLSKPFVGCLIAGASALEQVYQNAAAVDWRLDTAEIAEVDRLTTKEKEPSFKTSQ
jgi:aryl-alcohol dehydrogenase-like predicted oxidoreductase